MTRTMTPKKSASSGDDDHRCDCGACLSDRICRSSYPHPLIGEDVWCYEDDDHKGPHRGTVSICWEDKKP